MVNRLTKWGWAELRSNAMTQEKIEAVCPCCGQEVVIEYKPAKWENEGDKAVVTHVKWQEGWK